MSWWMHVTIVCKECLKAKEKFCRGCRSCAGCLGQKGLKYCTDCGWCDACVELKSVEWEIRKSECDEEEEEEVGPGFAMEKSCKHHVPGYWKTLDMRSERQGREKERQKLQRRSGYE